MKELKGTPGSDFKLTRGGRFFQKKTAMNKATAWATDDAQLPDEIPRFFENEAAYEEATNRKRYPLSDFASVVVSSD